MSDSICSEMWFSGVMDSFKCSKLLRRKEEPKEPFVGSQK
jgi:hypothetical protein